MHCSSLVTDDPLQEVQRIQEQNAAEFKNKLKDFPHTFQLPNVDTLGPKRLERFRSGLESALRVGYKTDLETARGRNLLAFFLHRLGHSEEALEELDAVLRMGSQEDNLVTHANKAVILFDQNRYSEAEEHVRTLHQARAENQDFQYLLVKAKAELAFTCTRLGPDFNERAITYFDKVIPFAREPEKWLWKFGLALTKRRRLRTKPETISPVTSSEIEDEERGLMQLLLEIARNQTCTKNLQAKAYAEIAMLLNIVWKNNALKNELVKKADLTRKQACEKALRLDATDNSVLSKCGPIFRYMRDTRKSIQLLSAAVSLRPTSTAYHHLGSTYKVLATDEKTKDMPKVKGFFRQMEERHSGESRGSYHDLANRFGRMSVGESNEPEPSRRDETARTDVARADDHFILSLDRDNRKMQRVVKSPPKGVTTFCRDDRFVEEVLENYQRAIDISRGENTRAVYDLAIMQKSLGELQNACKTFERSLKIKGCMHATEHINVYEQIGLCKREQAESETNEDERKRLHENANRMLYMALTFASPIFSKSPFMKERIGEVWQSFPSLFEAVERSQRDASTKRKEGAELLQLIGRHEESLELLQELKQMDPQQARDPKYLKLLIEGYVKTQDCEKACTFMKMLQCLPQSAGTLKLFGDKHFALKLHIQAAVQALKKGSPTAQSLFQMAFKDRAASSLNQPLSQACKSGSTLNVDSAAKSDLSSISGSVAVHASSRTGGNSAGAPRTDTEVKQPVLNTDVNRSRDPKDAPTSDFSTSSKAEDPDTDTKKLVDGTETASALSGSRNTAAQITSTNSKGRDVFLLHEEFSEKANSLLFYLRDVCGLDATSREDAIKLGNPEWYLQRVIDTSRVTVVLAEPGDHNDETLSYLISLAALSPSTLTLLVEDAQVPAPLIAYHALTCPDRLLQRDLQDTPHQQPGKEEDDVMMTLSDDEIKAIGQLFHFLCGIEGTFHPDDDYVLTYDCETAQTQTFRLEEEMPPSVRRLAQVDNNVFHEEIDHLTADLQVLSTLVQCYLRDMPD